MPEDPKKHKFGFTVIQNPADPTKPLQYFGGPEKSQPEEWKYLTDAKIQFVCPDGPFQLALMLIHPATGEVLPIDAVSPFTSNEKSLKSGDSPVNILIDDDPSNPHSMFATEEVIVRTPESAGIPPTGTGFVARYRYAVAVAPDSDFKKLILDTNQTGEWDHC